MAWRHHERERHGGVIFESRQGVELGIINHGDPTGRPEVPLHGSEWPRPTELKQPLFGAASRGPAQQIHRAKLQCGNDKRPDGFSEIMLQQSHAAIQQLYETCQGT